MTLNRTAMLLVAALFAAGCGGSKHGSTTSIPGGGNTTGTGTTPTVALSADATVAKGLTHPFQAHLAHDGVVDDCTATAQWASSDPAVASVSAAGVATALGLGQTTITASCSGYQNSATLVVGPAEVVTIAVTPATGELPVGLQEQLVAMATLTDATTADVTGEVVWSSSNSFAFDVSNAAGTAGVLTAKSAAGQSSTITAFHTASGALSTVTRTVSAATLASIVIDPLAPSVPLGVDVQFHATGLFSDGQSADVTPSVTWASSRPASVSFSTAPNDPGLAATLAADVVTITASCGAVAACQASPSSTTLTVTAPVVTAVAINQSGATLGIGETLQLTGTASFTDDSTQAVTLTGWTSSVPGVATVSDTGLLTAIAAGYATLGASYAADGQTFAATTQVQVVPPTSSPILSYLSLTPGSVKGGKSLKGVVAITAPATEATVVTLASSSSYVTVPASVTIPAGSSSVRFTITTARPPAKTKVTVRATLGTATKVATLNLRK